MAASFLTNTHTAPLPYEPRRPHLVLVEGGRSTGRPTARPTAQVYRRRRLAVALVAAVVVASGASIISSTLSSGSPAATASAGTYQVGAGDTLWSIATALDLDADRREVVDLLADANGGTTVRPGQRLVIPAEVVAMGS